MPLDIITLEGAIFGWFYFTYFDIC